MSQELLERFKDGLEASVQRLIAKSSDKQLAALQTRFAEAGLSHEAGLCATELKGRSRCEFCGVRVRQGDNTCSVCQ